MPEPIERTEPTEPTERTAAIPPVTLEVQDVTIAAVHIPTTTEEPTDGQKHQ